MGIGHRELGIGHRELGIGHRACSQLTNDINSGCAGMISEDTAVPFPYRDIVGILKMPYPPFR